MTLDGVRQVTSEGYLRKKAQEEWQEAQGEWQEAQGEWQEAQGEWQQAQELRIQLQRKGIS